jgi:hypothetical protein
MLSTDNDGVLVPIRVKLIRIEGVTAPDLARALDLPPEGGA